jgi:hypothetical protein
MTDGGANAVRRRPADVSGWLGAAATVALLFGPGCDSDPAAATSSGPEPGASEGAREEARAASGGTVEARARRGRVGPGAGRRRAGGAPALRRPATAEGDQRGSRARRESGRAGSGGSRQVELRDLSERQTVQAAKRAVERSTEASSEPCQKAYVGVRSVMASFGASADRGATARDTFMRGCARLPKPLQRCLAPDYRRDHEDECEKLDKHPIP